MYHINMEAVIPDRNLSISEGGIAPLGEEREAYVFTGAGSLQKKIKSSLNKPVKRLSEEALNILLYGNEEGSAGRDMDFENHEV